MASNFESEAPLIMDNIVSLFEEEDKFFAFKLGGSRGPSFFSVGSPRILFFKNHFKSLFFFIQDK